MRLKNPKRGKKVQSRWISGEGDRHLSPDRGAETALWGVVLVVESLAFFLLEGPISPSYVNKLQGFEGSEIIPKLRRILGSPQENGSIVQITGISGKKCALNQREMEIISRSNFTDLKEVLHEKTD